VRLFYLKTQTFDLIWTFILNNKIACNSGRYLPALPKIEGDRKMKKKLLPAFLTFGIAVLAFGAYYSQKSDYFASNLQSFENETREASESLELARPDSPDKAYEWRLLAWKDQNGQIPANPLSNAVAQRDQYLQQQAAQDGFSNGGVARLNWVARGPKNVGGRTRSLIIHPNDSNTIWAGSVGGGVCQDL
jgi:hypothetical protein